MARRVLEGSSANILVGEGATQFARKQQFPLEDNDSLLIPETKQAYEVNHLMRFKYCRCGYLLVILHSILCQLIKVMCFFYCRSINSSIHYQNLLGMIQCVRWLYISLTICIIDTFYSFSVLGS